MKIITIACMYNEVEKGNLRRCLKNISKFSDEIILFDDGSTDDSVEVAKEFTQNIILGGKNDFLNETNHLKQLMEKAVEMKADWIFKIDIDEIVDSKGTNGGIRELCERGIKENIDCFSFEEVTLFCSETWKTTKYLTTYFNRLWRNNGKLKFNTAYGLHNQLFPNGFQNLHPSEIKIIHYGYSSFEEIARRYKRRGTFGVPKETRDKALDIKNLGLIPFQLSSFPAENVPSKIDKNPSYDEELIKKLEDLKNGR